MTSPGPPGPATITGRPGMGVGTSALRPDGTLKVTGEFAFSSDLWMADMLWGATLRSPHPRARIRSVDLSGALRLPGVAAVLTCDDVPGLMLKMETTMEGAQPGKTAIEVVKIELK